MQNHTKNTPPMGNIPTLESVQSGIASISAIMELHLSHMNDIHQGSECEALYGVLRLLEMLHRDCDLIDCFQRLDVIQAMEQMKPRRQAGRPRKHVETCVEVEA